MTIINEKCNGCGYVTKCVIDSNYKYRNKALLCPCPTCLIKMMCTKACPEYSTLIKKFRPLLGNNLCPCTTCSIKTECIEVCPEYAKLIESC